MRVEGSPKVYAIADEDLERENEEKTSSVHFLRFELTREMAEALKYGVGARHRRRPSRVHGGDSIPVRAETRAALAKDLA